MVSIPQIRPSPTAYGGMSMSDKDDDREEQMHWAGHVSLAVVLIVLMAFMMGPEFWLMVLK